MPFGKGLDVIQQAPPGTDRTATLCAGILQNLEYNLMECQALVLAPTRELAQQIEKVLWALGDYQQVIRPPTPTSPSAEPVHIHIQCNATGNSLPCSQTLQIVAPQVNLTCGHAPHVKSHAFVGSTSVLEDADILQAGVHVVVGTPGRVYDQLCRHRRRGALRASSIRMFVLDKVDDLLSRGFRDQVHDIFQLLSRHPPT